MSSASARRGVAGPGPRPRGRAAPARRPVIRAAVEEALSRSADAAVEEARAFAALGQALAGDLDGDLDERGARAARRAGAKRHPARGQHREQRARRALFPRAARVDFAAAVGVAEEFLLGRFVVDAGDVVARDGSTSVLAERGRSTSAGAAVRRRPDRARAAHARGADAGDGRGRPASWPTRRCAGGPVSSSSAAPTSYRCWRGTRRCRSTSIACCSKGTGASTNGGSSNARSPASTRSSFATTTRSPRRPAARSRARSSRCWSRSTAGRRVRDIVRKLRMGSFDVSKMFFRLRRARLVRRRVPPPPRLTATRVRGNPARATGRSRR